MLVRLQKYLADAGVASRRACEQVILAGRVCVNRETVSELGSRVDPDHDEVTVDGTVVKPKRKLYLALNKPPGYICSRNDPLTRRSVNELLPKEWTNVYTVGRLDYESEGLIFLTNDGDFALCVSHPRFGIRKKYLATIEGRIGMQLLNRLKRGVNHEGEFLRAEQVRLLDANQSHSLVELQLLDGKNREVRRLFEAMGFRVDRLQRIQIGPIRLGELPSGKWRTLSPAEVKSLTQTSAEPRTPPPEPERRTPGPSVEGIGSVRIGRQRFFARPKAKPHGKPPTKPQRSDPRPSSSRNSPLLKGRRRQFQDGGVGRRPKRSRVSPKSPPRAVR